MHILTLMYYCTCEWVEHVVPKDCFFVFALLKPVLGHVHRYGLGQLRVVREGIVVLRVLDPARAKTTLGRIANLNRTRTIVWNNVKSIKYKRTVDLFRAYDPQGKKGGI